jgi:rhomboid protease GluP
MANCISCGIPLPSSTWGKSSDKCLDCRRMAAQSVVLIPDGTVAQQPAPPRAKVSSLRLSVTTVIVGINVAVFVLMALTGASIVEPNLQQLLKWGANWGPLSLGPQPWRVLTSNYVHIGIIHIFFNMWCLLNLGALAERVFDRWTYVLIYTVSGITGSLTSLWWHPMVYGAGASGAIFGLAGALLAALYLGKFPIPRSALKGTMKSLVMFAGYNLLFGLVPGIDNSAHIGGLVSGAALGAFFAGHLTAGPEERQRWRTYALVGTTAIIIVAFEMLKKQNALPGK